ncbi:MAG: exodeoxyribonuclease VII small subunit [Candidatus Obscuribacterales bacterium]|nr:exodeoxyribonuclease VII small subunit [Candidatus Obscuribacterales bacterium]
MNKSLDFEVAMKELEAVVAQLDGEVKLDKALALFEEGMKLSKECEDFLKGAEQKIEMLKRGENGALVTVPFVGDGSDDISGLIVPVKGNSDSAPAKKRKAAALEPMVEEHDSATNQLSLMEKLATTY